MSATQVVYWSVHNHPTLEPEGDCYLCNGAAYQSIPVKDVLKPTFTGYQDAAGDPVAGICIACAWSMKESNPDTAAFAGKPLSLRLFSHFVLDGQWLAYSKAHKARMSALLLHGDMPEVAVVSVSGQKHLLFKAQTNPPGQQAGWIQFEEHALWLELSAFRSLYAHVDALYQARFTKEAIRTGRYSFYPDSNLALWREHEQAIKSQRGGLLLDLCVYLVTKNENEEETRGE